MKVLQFAPSGVLSEVNLANSLEAINYTFEVFTLNSSQATSGTITLAAEPVANSETVSVAGLTLARGLDYDLAANASGTADIQFLPTMLAGGIIPVESGDEVFVKYAFQPINPTLEFKKTEVILSAIDLVNGYIDIPFQAIELSTKVFLGGFELVENADYTVTLGIGTTRVSFINQFAPGGLLGIDEGDQVSVQFTVSL